MKKLSFRIALAILPLFVSGCKIASSKRVVPQSTNSVLSFFTVEQYALNVPELKSGLSRIYGYAMVAPEEATFAAWSNPILGVGGCMYSSADSVGFAPKRLLDIGEMRLSGFNLAEVTLPKGTKQPIFSGNGRLNPGTYELRNEQASRTLLLKQSFTVSAEASNITLQSGAEAPIQPLATPAIAFSGEEGYLAVVDKMLPLWIRFNAPAGTQYVRMQISDGSAREESSVTCYGRPDEALEIPAEALNYFRSTDDGTLQVDFVTSSLATNQSKFKESLILTSIRHLHGVLDVYANDRKVTLHLGVLRFQ